MDDGRFDAMARALAGRAARRATLQSLAGAALAGALARLGLVAAAAQAEPGAGAGCFIRGRRCRYDRQCCSRWCRHGVCAHCPAGHRDCGRACVPTGGCCDRDDCGPDERCVDHSCEPCLGTGASCSADAVCCTGICDAYDNRCRELRLACDPTRTDQCPNGFCCEQPALPLGGRCFYDTLNNNLACGPNCDLITNCTNVSAVCRQGACCCPEGRTCNIELPTCAGCRQPRRRCRKNRQCCTLKCHRGRCRP